MRDKKRPSRGAAPAAEFPYRHILLYLVLPHVCFLTSQRVLEKEGLPAATIPCTELFSVGDRGCSRKKEKSNAQSSKISGPTLFLVYFTSCKENLAFLRRWSLGDSVVCGGTLAQPSNFFEHERNFREGQVTKRARHISFAIRRAR